jgi:hypothetical protein
MTGQDNDQQIPQAIVQAFEGRAYVAVPELSALLQMDRRTLRQHIQAGNLQWRQKGVGSRRPRRLFTLSDVIAFLKWQERGRATWHGLNSSDANDRLTGTSSSKLRVVAFAAPRVNVTRVARKPTSRTSGAKSPTSSKA